MGPIFCRPGEIEPKKVSALLRSRARAEAGAGRRLRALRRGPVRRLSACGDSCARAAKAKPAAVIVVKVLYVAPLRAAHKLAGWMTT